LELFVNGIIERVSIDGGAPEAVAMAPDSSTRYFAFSPDGKLMASTVTRSGTHERQMAVAEMGEKGPQVPTRFLRIDARASGTVEFTPDGKALVYSVAVDGVENLWEQPLDGKPAKQMTHFQSDTLSRFQFSPDGKMLGVLQHHSDSNVVLLRDTSRN
jgi:Tol biopolymer transport system component